jgi:hypothetical protein
VVVGLDLPIETLPESLADAAFPELLRTQLGSLASEHDFTLDETGDPDVTMRVRITQPEGQAAVYLITATAELDGETIAETREQVCLRCTPDEVASESLTILPGAVEQARKALAEAEPPPPEPTIDEPEDEPFVDARVAPLGPAGYVGIAASAVGLGAAIAGTVLMYRGEVVTSDPGAPEVQTTDYRTVGVALVGAGLGTMVLGNVLLAVDLGVLRERRSEARAELTGVGLLTRGATGLSVQGRF